MMTVFISASLWVALLTCTFKVVLYFSYIYLKNEWPQIRMSFLVLALLERDTYSDT